MWTLPVDVLPIFLGLGAAFCLGSSDFASREASKRIGSYSTTVYQLALGTLMLLLLTPIFGIPSLPLYVYGLLVVIALSNLGSVMLLYRGLQKGVVSVVAPVAYSYPAITLLLSIFVLQQSPTIQQILSIAGILAGAILVSTRISELRGNRGSGRKMTPGIGSACIAAIISGFTFFGLGIVARLAGPFLPILFMRGIGALAGFLLGPILKNPVRVSRYILSPRIMAVALLAIVAFFLFDFGVTSEGASISIVSSLAGMAGAVEAGYATVLLREKLESNQVLGVALLLAGVFSLLYFK